MKAIAGKKFGLALAIGVFIVSVVVPFVGAVESGEQSELQMWIMNSPPTPPVDVSSTIVSEDSLSSGSSVILDGVPTSEWTYGCTATSAGMLFGYYDRHGCPNMYTGPANGGVCPLTDLGQGIPTNPRYPISSSCYIIAAEKGLDGIAAKAHVDDYWISYGSPGSDPWEGNWAEHAWELCTADYLGTNQWKWDFNPVDGVKDSNGDGGTTFFYMADGSKLYDYIPPATCGLPQTACCHGMRLFAESRGYTVLTNYNQLTDNRHPFGFTFANLQAEINVGRPVLIHASSVSGGHTMLVLGYDTSTNKIYIYDTWDNNLHTMTWGGSYGGFTLMAVTVIHLQAVDVTPPTVVDYVPTGTDVPVTTTITVTFSEAMNHASVQNAFSISPSTSGSFSWSGDTLTFTPNSDLTHVTTYTVTIDTEATDSAGNHLQSPHNWEFTTTSPNQPPSILDIYPDREKEFQGNTIRIYCDSSDPETPESSLMCRIWIKPSGDSWVVSGETMSWSGNHHYYDWGIPSSAKLGYYDVKCAVSDGELSNWRTDYNEFQIDTTHTSSYVAILSPLDGEIIEGTTIICVSTTVENVIAVNLYVDDVYRGYGRTAPYEFHWDTMLYSNGEHEIQARAYSYRPVKTYSSETITVIVNNSLPTVTIISPYNGSTVSGTCSIEVMAEDEDKISRVRFHIDGTARGYDYSSPFQWNWDTSSYPNGPQVIQVDAFYTNLYRYVGSEQITVFVNNTQIQRTVTIISPSDGSTVSGIITVNVEATGDDLVRVYLYVDDKWAGYSETAPCQFSLNTASLSNGSHEICAVALYEKRPPHTQIKSKTIVFVVSNSI